MSYLYILAHADELHDASTSNFEHLITSLPVALPLFIGVNLAIWWLLKMWRPSFVIPALLAFNLVVGMLSYDAVPVVSILAITVGISSALLITLTLLAKG